ncbi:MAG: nucleotide exchange factor GrpE [Gammaproteobacteria bacterium]
MTARQKKKKNISSEEIEQEENIMNVKEQSGDAQADPAQDEVSQDDVAPEVSEETATEAEEPTIESLSEQIEVLKTAATDNLDRAVRAQAELDNVRKRTSRDIENAHKYALEKFINELLPVLDSLELGINASENMEDPSSLREGMELTIKMLYSALERSGVKPVEPQKGDKFNPDQHEAVTMQEVEDIESGAVTTTLQKGYELNGRLLRPAKVIVAK